ncbi:MAG: PTS system mannose/fructose/sorbose family transporter subunit IID, partial [Citrobacter freundii]|nr:PTS system mannose/fructose/sorbose family transporter subunit IID [Citrobacter freundii]
NGSAMGGIVPLILYPAITLAISYGMVHKGYTLGRDSIIGLLQGGRIKELIYGANVLGLIMMGALSASYVKITTPLKLSALKGSEVVVQQILDSIAPGLLPLAAVFAIYFYLVKKGPRYTTILLSIVALSVVCSLLGVL